MNIKMKISALVVTSLFVVFSLIFLVFSLSTLRTIEKFELEDIKSEVIFAKKTLDREQDNLKAYLYDWGFWNDTYYFLQGKGKQEYIEANLTKDFLLKLPNRCIAYIDKDGKLFHAVYIDHERKALVPLPVIVRDFILKNAQKLKNKTGLIVLDSKIYFVGSQEVLKNDFTGPSTGLFFVMRDYKPAIFENKRPSQFNLDLDPWSVEKDTRKEVIEKDKIIVHELLNDILDRPEIIGTAVLKRTMHVSTKKLLWVLFFITTALSLMLSVLVLFVTKRLFLLQQKLFHNNRLASIGVFGSGIAHELNNPLSVIMGFAEQIREEIKNEPTSKEEIELSTEKILNHANRMKKIIDHVRTFSRSSSLGKAQVKAENINDIVDESLILLHKQIGDRGIELILDLDNGLPKVLIDKVKIESVIQNLVSNAKDELDAIEGRKGKKIKIQTGLSNNGRAITISITDNGRGIAAKLHKYIFDPFYTTKSPGKGTGLGLSIVHGIITDAGGSIRLESELNKGTTFMISLPAYKDPKEVK